LERYGRGGGGGGGSTNHHVQVVEPAWLRVLGNGGCRAGDADDIGPATPVVDTHAPALADRVAPGPHAVAAPVAQGEEQRVAGALEHVAHLDVPGLRRAGRVGARLLVARVAGRVAVVVLPVVNAPAGEELGVLLLVALAARVSAARHGPRVAVQTELEAHGVDLIRERLHTVGKLLRVGHEEARAVAGFGRPAVVEVHVEVAGVLEPQVDKGLGRVQGHGGGGRVASSLVLTRESQFTCATTHAGQKHCIGLLGRHTQLFHPRAGVFPRPFSYRG
jgi:hypothetical protein